jgi:hypothetical protein
MRDGFNAEGSKIMLALTAGGKREPDGILKTLAERWPSPV